jgi:hypothetical protein
LSVAASHALNDIRLAAPVVKYNDFASRRARRSEFAFEINAAAKRPREHNKRGNKQDQGESKAFVRGKKAPGR